VVLAAVYTSQRRGDVPLHMNDHATERDVWYLQQGKPGTALPVPLHPVVLAIIDIERTSPRRAAIVDPKRPLLTNSRGTPWTPSGFGASWIKELIRLKLRPATIAEYAEGAFRPRFHGLRHTNATMIANTVTRNPEVFGGIDRVKSMLGHQSERMAKQYTRRATAEDMNARTMLLIPEIGNRPAWIGNQDAE
jgi:integrase